MMTGRSISCVIACCAVLVPGFVESSRADLVLLKDGRWQPCRIVKEQVRTYLLKTAEGVGAQTLRKSEVKEVYREVEEAQQIGRCRDLGRLRRWAAAYHGIGLEPQAIQCIRQAWKLDSNVGQSPLQQGKRGFRDFWNRVILKERAAALTGPRVGVLADLARWAHDANLDEEAADYLRKGWSLDRKSDAILSIAKAWGVQLESAIQIDLRPALRGVLISPDIRDQGQNVQAKPGHVFFLIPLRYDLHARNFVISRSTVVGKGRRGYYGVRPLRGRIDLFQGPSNKDEPVYERLEFLRRPDGGTEVVLKNSLGPRPGPSDPTPRTHLRGQGKTMRPSGTALLIVEVADRAKSLKLRWDDGGSETIDLRLVRKVNNHPGGGSGKIAADGPEVGGLLARLRKAAGASAELTIAYLAQLRERVPPERHEAWSAVVDKQIIAAGARLEHQVRSAAWRYFLAGRSVAAPALRVLAAADAATKRRWIEIIGSHRRHSTRRDVLVVARQLLGAVLQSKDQGVCEAALDVLLAAENDWSLLGQASETAQLAAMNRLRSLPKDQAARMLFSLSPSVRRTAAKKIADYARSVHLTLTDPRDRVLSQWSQLSDPADQLALLTLLKAVDLGDLIYSQPLAAILQNAGQEGSDPQVRDAAFALLTTQVQRWMAVGRAGRANATIQTDFPVLISMTANDPVVAGLTEAVASGSPEIQVDALELLLLGGFAAQAGKGLLASKLDPGKIQQVLHTLLMREEVAASSGLLAFLGRLLDKAHLSCADTILSHLDAVVADQPEDRWRVWAATKAGADIKALDRLAAALQPPTSKQAVRWLNALCHITLQERQRLAATGDPEQRSQMLDRIDLRRGQLVDGRYGVVAILEQVEPTAAAAAAKIKGGIRKRRQWRAPRRITITLAPLSLRSNDEDQTYRVFWNERSIGEGVIRDHLRVARGPASFSPMLDQAPPEMRGPSGWGWPMVSGGTAKGETALGPTLLPGNRPVRKRLSPGTMTLDITEYLRAGLASAAVFEGEDLTRLVPRAYKITLRYAAFGSYYGVGVRRPLPRQGGKQSGAPSSLRPHLINVMLVLERMD